MQKGLTKTNTFFIAIGLIIGVCFALFIMKAPPANAATGVSQRINFQGRLLNSQGATVPDGYYNVEFKVYQDGDGQSVGDTTGSPAGALKWTEDHLNNSSQGVRVVNGYLSVQLGSVTPFGANINWNQDTLWLSMNIAGTGPSCTPFSSCTPDGEMIPMQSMTSAPYALNSGQLGGLSSSQFVQLAQGLQTDASASNSIYINKTGSGNMLDLQATGSDVFVIGNTGDVTSKHTSTTAFQVQNAAGATTYLAVDTSGGVVSLGVTGSTNANSTVHIADSSAGVQTVTIGSTNSTSTTTVQSGSGGIALSGNTSVASNKSFTANGAALFKDATNSATAFQIQNADASNTLLAADTSGSKIYIGKAGKTAAYLYNFDNNILGVGPNLYVESGLVVSGSGYAESNKMTTLGTNSNGTTPLYVKGYSSSQTADLMQVAGYNGASQQVVLGVTSNGDIYSKGIASSTTAFQVQNAGGTNFLAIDTSGNIVNLGITGSTNTNSTVHIADSSAGVQTVTVGSTNSTSSTTVKAGSGGITLTGNTSVSGASTFATGTGIVGLNGNTTVAADKSFTAGGSALFKDNTNSPTAFQIQNTDSSNNLFIADTQNSKIGIGAAPTVGGSTLQITGSMSATTDVSAGTRVVLSSSSDTSGRIEKALVAGTTGWSVNNVVVLANESSSTKGIVTNVARDTRVYGVAVTTQTAGQTGNVAISGNFQVMADSSIVSIGDQLVTSTTSGDVTANNSATTGILGIATTAKSAGSPGLVGVMISPVNGQSSPTFYSTTFKVQNAAGTNTLFNIDTVTPSVTLGSSSGASSLTLDCGTGACSFGATTTAHATTLGSTTGTSATTVQAGSGGVAITSASGVSLNGSTTVTTGNNFTVTDGSTNLGGTLDVTSSFATKKGTDFSASGQSDNVNFGTTSLVRLTGSVAQTISGITGGRDGYNLTIVNANTNSLAATILNNSSSSTAANRITTGTGGSLSLPVGAMLTLIYDSGANLWRTSSDTSNLQTAYNNSTVSPQITLNNTNNGLAIQDANGGLGAGVSLFAVQNYGGTTKYINVDAATVAITDNVTASGTYNTNTFNATTLQFGGASGTVSSGTGNLSIQAATGSNTLLLDTVSSGGNVAMGTTAGTLNIATGNLAHIIHIGDGGTSTAQTITIGSTSTSSSVVIQSGSGGNLQLTTQGGGGILGIGNNTVAQAIQIGNNTGTTSVAVSCGTGTCGFGNNGVDHSTTVGSTNGVSATTVQSGSGGITLTGNTSVSGASTFATGTGIVGLNGNTTVAADKSFTAGGSALFKDNTNSPTAFQIQNTDSSNNLFIADTQNSKIGIGAAPTVGGSTLQITGSMSATTDVSAGTRVVLSSSSDTSGRIEKALVAGTTGWSVNNVVVLANESSSTKGIVTNVARDTRVYGVAVTTQTAGQTGNVAISGNFQVMADSSIVSIGDQLVTSTTSGDVTANNSATTGILGIATTAKSAGSPGLVGVMISPVNGQSSPTFYSTTFKVQNAAGTNTLFNIDTVTPSVTLGSSSGASSLTLDCGTGACSFGATTTAHATTLGSTTGTSATTVQAGSGGVAITSASGVSLNGSTTVTTGNNFTVTDGSTNLGGTLDVTSSFATKKGTDFSASGQSDNVNFGTTSLVRLTGSVAQTISGITGGRDGYNLTIVNANTNSLAATILNNSSSSTAANRITTGTGGSLSLPVGAMLTLIYDSGANLWRTSSDTSNLQTAYNNSTVSPQITLNNTNNGLAIQDASTPIGASLFAVQNYGGTVKYINVDASTVAITDNVTVSGTYNTNTFNATTLQFGGASGTVSSGSGNLSIQAAGTNSLLLDTAGLGTVGIATSNAGTVNIATNDVAHNLYIGSGGASAVQAITIGSTGSTSSSVKLYAGSTGGITLYGPTTVSGTNTFTSGTGAVSLNGNTTVANNMSLTANGAALFKDATNSATAFRIQNQDATNTLFTADTTGSKIYIGATGKTASYLYDYDNNILGIGPNAYVEGSLVVGASSGYTESGKMTTLGTNSNSTTPLYVKGYSSSQTADLMQVAGYNGASQQVVLGVTANGGVYSKNIANTSAAFQVQNSSSASLLNIDTTGTNLAVNGGAEAAFGSEWSAFTGGTVTRDTTANEFISGVASVKDVVTATNTGAQNNLGAALAINTTYIVSFSAKASSTNGTADIAVAYYRATGTLDTGGSATLCTATIVPTIFSTSWTKHTCSFTTSGTAGAATAFLAISQTQATSRNIFIDNLNIAVQTANGSLNVNQIRIGGATGQGLTLLTADSYAAAPTTNTTINPALYGSMYYDTTMGKIQCYNSTGWGNCGVSPDVSVNLIPEYAGLVLHGIVGSDVGTLTSDICSGTSKLSINTSICAAAEDYNYYQWTSPQTSAQTYSLYVRYQLPATFKSFASANTILLTARTSDITNGNGVKYTMYTPDGAVCGTANTQVTSTANTWQQASINGTGCNLEANDIIMFKIDVTASSVGGVPSSAYVSNLSFLTKGQ
jgi:hypothetical protein